ncbi:MAG: S8 family serine peptidase, partial [Clostridiaceae bacterium]|nr:S8 family serine peptidase [Clostridiaceae bacterium]
MRENKAFFSVLIAVIFLTVNIMTASAAAFVKPYKGNDRQHLEMTYKKKEIIVKYKHNKSSSNEEIKKNLKKSLKNRNLKHNKKLSGSDYEVMEFYEDEDMDSIVESLEKDPDIELVQPDYELELLDETDFGSVQTAVYRSGEIIGLGINVLKAWELTKGSKEVIVGILDNDVDIFHKDLSKNVFTNPGEIPENGLDDDNNGYIDDVNGMDFANDDNTVFDSQEEEHGTAVAGVVAAAGSVEGISGIAPDVRILPMKFMNGKTGKTSDAIEAINYARKLGVRVIVCSWGSVEYSPLLKEAMEESGIVFACAAGNDGTSQYIYPAAFGLPNIISVAASDRNGSLADFSNYGDRVDLAAPGVDIYTTVSGGKYGYKSGTSLAAPHAAAAAALLLSTDGQLSAKDVAATIKGNVRVVPELQGKVVSGGVLDLYSSLINTIKYNEDLYKDINPEEFMASQELEENAQKAIISLLNSGHSFADVLKAYYACENMDANMFDAVMKEDNNTEELLNMETSFDNTELAKIVQLADKHYLSALFLLKYAERNELTADKLEDLLDQAEIVRPLDAADNFNDLEYTEALLKNGVSAPLNLSSVSEENIDPATGNLEVKQTDLYLKGINGMDFALTRFYSLNEANLGKPYMGRSYGTRYENGVPVYTGMLPRMKVEEVTDKDEHYNLGTGWSFDLPYVKVKDSGYGTLYLGSAGAWSLEGTRILDTNYDKIIGYQFSDMELEENYQYQFGDTDIKYILSFKDGRVMNFDSIGRILSIADRFGNRISFKHTRKFNSNYVLSSINDSVGRKISFSYAEDNSQVTVTLTDPNSPENNKTVYYNKSRVPDTGNEFILDNVVVTGNDKTKNREFKYKYSYLSSYFDYKDGDRVDGAGTLYACLTDVHHKTGGSTKYEYTKRTKKMGKYGEMGYYKVSKRVDTDEKGREYNLKNFEYAYDGSGEYDGYPKYYEYYPGTKTKVTDSNGNTEIYTFGKYLLCEEILSQGQNHKNQVINQYENKQLKKKITRVYNTQTNSYIESIENYQFARNRDLLGYWSTRSDRDANGMPLNDEAKTLFTYNYYSDLKSKIYKRDSSSTIIEEYAPDESNGGKSIEYARVYEMLHKSPSLFNYDTDMEPLAAGEYSSFAIMGDGTVRSWGDNGNGELGRQYSINNTIEGLKYVKQISAGGSHALALMYDGSVKVWGSNEYFQIGLSGSYDYESPKILKGLNNVKQVAAGGAFSLALMKDGSVKAWGRNDKGQLGLGDTKDRKVPTTIQGLTGVRELVAGGSFSIALMNDGTVKTWGRNLYGELGLGDKTSRLQPTVVPGLSNVKKIAVGGYNAIALLNDGTVKHWGFKPNSLVPATVQGVSNVKQVQAGSDFLLALLNDGTV